LVRVGFGTDSHPFEDLKEKPLILGGVKIGASGGLKANSDGDVILHALFNAISQACGGHSIGHYADPLLKNGVTDSRAYLEIALKMVRDLGYGIQNIGIMVEAAAPRIELKKIGEMKGVIASLAGLDEADVGITFTSGEGLTSFGKGEGMLAQAIVSLVRK
jgi:2-C-methyl-D-erythritol 2,4-cyclodiphosphate synthase